jgi:hypothetical protein
MFIILLVYLEFRRYISSGSLIDERILESPKWESKVDFTLKELILHDIDKRRTEYIENMFTKLQNKILVILIGATMSTIITVIGFNKWYVDEASKKIDDVKLETGRKIDDVRSILDLDKNGKKIIDDVKVLLENMNENTNKKK